MDEIELKLNQVEFKRKRLGQLMPTPFERFIIEARVEGKTCKEITEAFNEHFGKKISESAIVKWLRRDHVVEALVEAYELKLGAGKWTKDRIIRELSDIALSRRDKKTMNGQEVSALKEIAKLRGYMDQEGARTNVQIELVQANGQI